MARRRRATRNPPDRAPRALLALAWRASLPDSAAQVAWSSSGILGVATLAGPVLFFAAAEGALLHQAPGHAGGALAVAFCPASPLVATGGEDGQVHLHDPSSTSPHRTLDAGAAAVAHLSWSPDGEVLASAAGRVVRFWSRAGERLGEVGDHPSTVTSLVWSEPLQSWVSSCYGGAHLLAREGLQRARHLSFRTSILIAAPSPEGRYLAAGTQDPVVRVWDLATGDDPINLEGYPGKVPLVAWGAETRILATASASSVVLWSFAGGDPRGAAHLELHGHGRRVSALSFLDGGRMLLTAAGDGHVRVFDLTVAGEGEAVAADLDLGAPLHLAAVAPGGASAVAAGTDGSLALLRLA